MWLVLVLCSVRGTDCDVKTRVVFSMPGQLHDGANTEDEGSSADTPYGKLEACTECGELISVDELWTIGEEKPGDAYMEPRMYCDSWRCFQSCALAFTAMLALEDVEVLKETDTMMQWYDYIHRKADKNEWYDPTSATELYRRFAETQGQEYRRAEFRARKRAEAEAEESAKARKTSWTRDND